jgi:dTDP-4-dehydrorhamnose reductase
MKVLVTGAGGLLAQVVSSQARQRGHTVVEADRAQLDVTDAKAVSTFIARARPHAVIQCAGYTRVDDAEREEERALAVNAGGTAHVARACNSVNACLLYPSSDYVFDGSMRRPYRPDDAVNPLNAYGRSKVAGEATARGAARHLIVRTSWLYGATGKNFVGTILTRARAQEPLRVVTDQVGSPTWSHDLARTLILLLELDAPAGIYHACNRGETTWFGLASAALELAGLSTDITPIERDESRPARRPAYSVLDCTATEALTGPLPHWRDALADAMRAGGL